MDRNEINQAEWENPANWTAGPKWLSVYFSHRDSRTWVPKRIPWMGVTINLAKPGAVVWLIGYILGVPLIIFYFNIIYTDIY